MNLRRQPRKDYNRMNYNDNVSNITDETQDDGIILLQINSDSLEITEAKFDKDEAEYMFLTKTLGWKEGLNEGSDPAEADTNNVTKLSKYLFLTEQM